MIWHGQESPNLHIMPQVNWHPVCSSMGKMLQRFHLKEPGWVEIPIKIRNQWTVPLHKRWGNTGISQSCASRAWQKLRLLSFVVRDLIVLSPACSCWAVNASQYNLTWRSFHCCFMWLVPLDLIDEFLISMQSPQVTWCDSLVRTIILPGGF